MKQIGIYDTKCLIRSMAYAPHLMFEGHAERSIARVAHAGCALRSAHIARMDYTARDMAERVFALRRQRPVSACMVKDAPRKDGVSAWRAQGVRSVPGLLAACRERPVLVTRSAAVGGKMRGLQCGRRGGDSGARGDGSLARREPLKPLGPALDFNKLQFMYEE